jgi:hypothetical protein
MGQAKKKRKKEKKNCFNHEADNNTNVGLLRFWMIT